MNLRISQAQLARVGGHRGASHADEATVGAMCRSFLRLGALGFDGPVALAGYMHRHVERLAEPLVVLGAGIAGLVLRGT